MKLGFGLGLGQGFGLRVRVRTMTIVPETVVAERASVLLSRLREPTTASACLGLGLALP